MSMHGSPSMAMDISCENLRVRRWGTEVSMGAAGRIAVGGALVHHHKITLKLTPGAH